MLAFSILAAGLMVGADRAYAQSAGMRQPPAKKDTMIFDIPESMKAEHDSIGWTDRRGW